MTTSGNDKVSPLVKRLAGAKRRGVKIEVILEGSRLESNYPAYRYLKDRGVNVWMDTSANFIHEKAILIDNKCLIAGSHNWTENSLDLSREVTLVTRDRRSIKQFKDHFRLLGRQRETISRKQCKNELILPLTILVKSKKRGVGELKKYNLLEVLASIPKRMAIGYRTEPYYYRLNPFYSLDSFFEKLNDLKDEFSKRTVSGAQKVAAYLGDNYDLEKIRIISLLIKRCGLKSVLSAGRGASRIRGATSKRSISYLYHQLGVGDVEKIF